MCQLLSQPAINMLPLIAFSSSNESEAHFRIIENRNLTENSHLSQFEAKKIDNTSCFFSPIDKLGALNSSIWQIVNNENACFYSQKCQ